MNRLGHTTLLLLALSVPASAQMMDRSSMPGMTMPMPAATPPAKAKTAPVKARVKAKVVRRARAVRASTSSPSMAKQSQSGMTGMDMSSPAKDGTGAMPGMSEGDIPSTPPPPPPIDHLADRYFDPAAMATARETLRGEHGGERVLLVMANILEYQTRSRGEAGYRWEGEARYGGDIDRFVLKTEGSGGREIEDAEVQGLYSRAIDPYFDVQVGVRHDFKSPSRTYATVGFEGLAPYWFDVQGAVFLSNKGELLGRLESTYDFRLSQKLMLQPRAELNLSAKDTAETETGPGLSTAELGIRLRYEITRDFAPYIGISYDRSFGKTAEYVRSRGENPATTKFVVGIRVWF